jgi:arylsulfatase A-like enzyme
VRLRSTTLSRFLAAGALLGALEVTLVLVTERHMFLSARELARYAAFALGMWPLVVLGVGACGAAVLGRIEGWRGREADATPAAPTARVQRLVTLAAWPIASWSLWLLTSGRRARELPGRAWLAIGLGLGAAYGLGWLATKLLLARRDPRAALGWRALLGAAAVAALIADMYALRRLYPAFHALLACTALLAACGAAALWPENVPGGARPRVPSRSLARWQVGLALALCAYGAVSLRSLPNARFAITEVAPLSGKLLRASARLGPRARGLPIATEVAGSGSAPRASGSAAPATAHGVDLRGRDVLFVTVDALRADMLGAYGSGARLTPALDALAAEGAVFERAYTPTPHTSYALTSVLTSKYMQPLLALGERGSEHPTLADLLRRHGYRTAAFYPPAIFFVDPERFAGFSERHLGFEYVKAMFATVEQQVAMVEEYLQQAPPELPVFAWVHVFEPHEPYEPPARFARGDSPRERYQGEVAAADEGVGRLVAAFRRARPGATVIVSADHGEEFGEHGGHHHGTTLFDEQTRVPWLWSSPGAITPRRIEAAVDLVDLGATLLSALGVPREARMRGDDLTGLLAGAQPAGPMHAFSSIDGAQMVTDGRFKLACEPRQCRLFDLRADPAEREDIASRRAHDVQRLRSVLAEMAASLPRVEALALDGDKGWPPALSRARMGDVTVAGELPPLLSSSRAEVRAEAARALAGFEVGAARPTLARLAETDPDDAVRAESAIAALALGDVAQLDRVAEVTRGSGPADRVRRAGLALAARGDARGADVLLPAALDATLDERERVAALEGLATVGVRGAAKTLVPLLDDVRLRPRVATTLGKLGERAVLPALLRAFAEERYPEARAAEARALLALGARRQALAGVERYLGMASSMPAGVALMLEAGALRRGAAIGADLVADERARRGAWTCDPDGCVPALDAELVVRRSGARASASRLTLLVHADRHGRSLSAAGTRVELAQGASEVAIALPATPRSAEPLALPIATDAGVRVRAFVLVPDLPELPPPPKEPWEPEP